MPPRAEIALGTHPSAASLTRPRPPVLVLCGHVHESFGQTRQGRTLIVNAATGYALLDLDHGGAMRGCLRWHAWIHLRQRNHDQPTVRAAKAAERPP